MIAVDAEETVQRLGVRPGYRLLTYRAVGLPYWEMPLRCRLLEKTTISTMDEFVLRCVEAELRRPVEIASFLGLSDRVLAVVMGRLVTAGHITPAKPNSSADVEYSLSQRGQRMLADAGEIVPVERTLPVAFDGLLRRFTLVDQTLRWRPRDLREHDVMPIPAFPADPPEVGPSCTLDVSAALAAATESAEFDLLSVLALDGRREQFYVCATAMIFESKEDGEVSVHFAIDGRPSDSHDLAFARAEGKSKLGILDVLSKVDGPAERLLTSDTLARRADDPKSASLRQASDILQTTITDLQHRLPEADLDARETLAEQISDLEVRLDQTQAELALHPVRFLEVFEHAEVLQSALRTAQDRLLIVSPWIRSTVVNREFLSELEGCLGRGVSVWIGHGIDDGADASERERSAERSLASLADSYENFQISRLGDTHAKVLVVDRAYVVVTSFNWLSFRGDPQRPFRDERGTMVRIPVEIDRIFEEYRDRIEDARS